MSEKVPGELFLRRLALRGRGSGKYGVLMRRCFCIRTVRPMEVIMKTIAHQMVCA